MPCPALSSPKYTESQKQENLDSDEDDGDLGLNLIMNFNLKAVENWKNCVKITNLTNILVTLTKT
jgi:hypothetical protein